MFCLPISKFMYLWVIYIFPESFCLFCCSQIDRPILGITYNVPLFFYSFLYFLTTFPLVFPCSFSVAFYYYPGRCGTPTPVSARRLWAGGAGSSPSSASPSHSTAVAAYSSSSLPRYCGHVTSSGPISNRLFYPAPSPSLSRSTKAAASSSSSLPR